MCMNLPELGPLAGMGMDEGSCVTNSLMLIETTSNGEKGQKG